MFPKSRVAIGCLLVFAGAPVLAPQATASSPPLALLKTGHARQGEQTLVTFAATAKTYWISTLAATRGRQTALSPGHG
jgi:hypothetical protein